ncbi:hypothetical protein L249_0682, partial [Ophiocordyceps polyrhachis-furcata BCC 54312]
MPAVLESDVEQSAAAAWATVTRARTSVSFIFLGSDGKMMMRFVFQRDTQLCFRTGFDLDYVREAVHKRNHFAIIYSELCVCAFLPPSWL